MRPDTCHRNEANPVDTGLLVATGATGLEPATSGVTGRRSNQLSYAPPGRGLTSMARETGPDPPAETGASGGAATRRSAEGFRGVNRSARRSGLMSHSYKGLLAAPVIAGAIALVAAGTAVALEITGTDGPDRIIGSRTADTINALAGPDRIFAHAGNDTVGAGDGGDRVFAGAGSDTVDAGLGDDRVFAGRGDDSVDAGPGFDRVRGRAGNDTISGGEGFDVLRAGRGQDTVSGGPGNDRLLARAHLDPATDTVNGDEGDDRILVRDAHHDVVTCGPGFDRVIADETDTAAADCEVVRMPTRAGG